MFSNAMNLFFQCSLFEKMITTINGNTMKVRVDTLVTIIALQTSPLTKI